MAKFNVNGAELVVEQINRMGRPMMRKIVEAGAQAAERRMRENTERARHVRNRDMMDAIGDNGISEGLEGASTEVYPQGDDRRGERNATKAYVINYGRGKRPYTKRPKKNPRRNLTGDKFITGDEKKAEEVIRAAMQAESDRLSAENN